MDTFKLFAISVGIFIVLSDLIIIKKVLNLFDLSLGEILFRTLERKKSGEKPLPLEKRSRERVSDILNNNSLSAKEKCFAINDEIGKVDSSIFVSREWKNELCTIWDNIVSQNSLTLEELLH